MRYLLVVGFACDVYRREPRARIFVGNKLIDEFLIQRHIDTMNTEYENFFSNRQILQPHSILEFNNMQIKNFPSLQFYEFEINEQQKELEIRIDIDNNDSNSNNGFMTKSTLLKLKVFYFIPFNKKLLSIFKKMLPKNKKNKNCAWTQRKKSHIFNLNVNGVEWHGKNGQIIETNNNVDLFHSYTIGGDGYFICKLIKKYGMYITKLSKPYRFNFSSIFLNYFIDKYEQHANQRNNN